MVKINLQLFATTDKDKKYNTTVNGVDQETLNKGYNNIFKGSDNLAQRESESDNAYNNFKTVATKQFENSYAYNQAMDFTNSQWDKISTGKTSWTDEYNNLLNKYLNREDFEYDVNKDPLFQQALTSAMNSGKTAMQDTIGQASALTGGYGSTYATSAGNQAYNSFIEDAYNNLPEYYQMALNAHQAEGQEMYNQVALVGEADSKEFQRNFDLYSASFDRANQIWNQDFSLWDANINNSFNLYNAANDRYESQYSKEYNAWADEVTQAQQYAQMLNTDSQWQQTFDFNKDQAAISQSNWEKEYNLELAANNAKIDNNGKVIVENDNKSKVTPTQRQQAAKEFEEGGIKGLEKYVTSLGYTEGGEEEKDIMNYVNSQADTSKIPYSSRTWTIIDDGGTNWFGGVDNNVIVEDQFKNKVKLSDLKQQDKELAKKLSKLAKGETYNP